MGYRVEICAVTIGVVVVEASSHTLALAAGALGVGLPEGAFSTDAGAVILHRNTPEKIMLLTPTADAPDIAAHCEAIIGTASAIVVDLTDAHAWLEISGPDAIAVLSQGIALDLRETIFATNQTLLTTCFGIEAILHRVDADIFRIGCRASYGEFLLARLCLAVNPLQRVS